MMVRAPAIGVADTLDRLAVLQDSQLDKHSQAVIGRSDRQPGQARDVGPATGATGDRAQERHVVFDVSAQFFVELEPDSNQQAPSEGYPCRW
jgi:hypothetical protein